MDSSWTEISFRRALLVAVLVTLLPPMAHGEDADSRAQAATLHERGLVLYQSGDYAGAAQAFESAQSLAPAPSNLFNLSRCYERLGDVARAALALERYIASDGLPEDRRTRGQRELERLRALADGPATRGEPVEIAIVTEPAGAALFVDGRPQEGAVTPVTRALQPGEHMIEVRLDGHESAREEIVVEPGRARVVQLTLTAGEETADAPPEAPRVGWTGSIQIDAGAAFALTGDHLGATGLVGLELTAGLRLGRGSELRGRPWRLVRLELVLGFVTELGPDQLLEAIGGGRLSIGLGSLPIRVEGEVAVGLTILPQGTRPELGLAVIPGFAIVYSARHWLEIAFRPARLEIVGLLTDSFDGTALRWGLDAQVRFRI